MSTCGGAVVGCTIFLEFGHEFGDRGMLGLTFLQELFSHGAGGDGGPAAGAGGFERAAGGGEEDGFFDGPALGDGVGEGTVVSVAAAGGVGGDDVEGGLVNDGCGGGVGPVAAVGAGGDDGSGAGVGGEFGAGAGEIFFAGAPLGEFFGDDEVIDEGEEFGDGFGAAFDIGDDGDAEVADFGGEFDGDGFGEEVEEEDFGGADEVIGEIGGGGRAEIAAVVEDGAAASGGVDDDDAVVGFGGGVRDDAVGVDAVVVEKGGHEAGEVAIVEAGNIGDVAAEACRGGEGGGGEATAVAGFMADGVLGIDVGDVIDVDEVIDGGDANGEDVEGYGQVRIRQISRRRRV